MKKYIGLKPLDLSDVPVDLLPREMSQVEITDNCVSKRSVSNVLSGVESSGENNVLSWQLVILALGAFFTIYLVVCEMNKKRR